MSHIELLIQGNFLNLIKAELYLTAGYSLTGFSANFYVRVTVDLSGINKVRKSLKISCLQSKLKKITLLSSPQEEEVCLFVGVIALIYNIHKAYKLYYRIH